METRATRYSKKNRLKKMVKKIFKLMFKNVIYLLVGLFYIMYCFIKLIDDLISKWFMMLPRLIKVMIIYLLVANLFIDTTKINTKEITISLNEVNSTRLPIEVNSNEEKEQTCLFDSTSCKIAETGKKIGLTEEQILISISISRWETGNYTSEAFKEKNNVGGMMCNSGLISYSTLDDGIEAFLNNLKNNYFDIGLTTLELIQPKYCPIGAENDPNNLNQYWLNGTNRLLDELKK